MIYIYNTRVDLNMHRHACGTSTLAACSVYESMGKRIFKKKNGTTRNQVVQALVSHPECLHSRPNKMPGLPGLVERQFQRVGEHG